MTLPACIIWTLLGLDIWDIPNIICSGTDTLFTVTFIVLAKTLKPTVKP